MATTARTRNVDPFAGFRFRVKWTDLTGNITHHAGFTKVSGLEEENETIEYREGTDDTPDRKFPGKLKYGRVTLSRGMSENDELRHWRQTVAAVMHQATSADLDDADFNLLSKYRRNVTIELIARNGKVARSWTLLNAYPAKWAAEDFDAMASNAAMESVELEHEGLIHEFTGSRQRPVSGADNLAEFIVP